MCPSGDGVAAASFPWWTCVLGLRRCDDVFSNVGVEPGRSSRSTRRLLFAHCHSWKMVYPVLVLWLEADSSGFFLRRCSRAGMSVLELDGVSGDMLPRSDSFNDNGFASGKRLWRSVKLLISDGAASSLGEEVTCLPSLWWLLQWCRRREIGAGFLHRFILSFQVCKVGVYVPCNLISSYK